MCGLASRHTSAAEVQITWMTNDWNWLCTWLQPVPNHFNRTLYSYFTILYAILNQHVPRKIIQWTYLARSPLCDNQAEEAKGEREVAEKELQDMKSKKDAREKQFQQWTQTNEQKDKKYQEQEELLGKLSNKS